jgi:hypothetical protein
MSGHQDTIGHQANDTRSLSLEVGFKDRDAPL